MVTNGEKQMEVRLASSLRLGVLRDDEAQEEEQAAIGGVAGLVDRWESLTLAGGIEGGGFKIPGLMAEGGGAIRRIGSGAALGDEEGDISAGRESGGSVLSQGFGLYVTVRMWRGGVFSLPGRTGTGGLGVEAISRVLVVAKRSPWGGGVVVVAVPLGFMVPRDCSKWLGRGGGSPSFLEQLVTIGLRKFGWDGGSWWGNRGRNWWNGCYTLIRVELGKWRRFWDVGWKYEVWKKDGSTGGKKRVADLMDTSSSGENKGANPFLPAED